MIGNAPQVKDIDLELHELVLPENLLSEESLSPDTEGVEEVELFPYKVDSYCSCGTGVRAHVLASRAAISTLQLLLSEELRFICLECVKAKRNGR